MSLLFKVIAFSSLVRVSICYKFFRDLYLLSLRVQTTVSAWLCSWVVRLIKINLKDPYFQKLALCCIYVTNLFSESTFTFLTLFTHQRAHVFLKNSGSQFMLQITIMEKSV